jgi:long-chain acyl-CoA synthetase
MKTIWKLWETLVELDPSRRLVHMPGRGWTNAGEIDTCAREIADSWLGEPLYDRIVLMAVPNGPEWLAVFLALKKLGAIAAPADPSTPALLLDKLAADIGAGWTYCGGALHRNANALPRRHTGDFCLAKITSGSTGTPRALLFHAGEMIADGSAVCDAMGICSNDINYAMIPFGHSYGLGNLVIPLIMHGCASACSSSPLPRIAVREMREAGVTVCPSVPSFFRALNDTDIGPDGLGKLRLAISAGSALPPAVARDFERRFGLRIHNFLGSSETGGIAYDSDGGASLGGTSVGRLMPGVSVSQGKDGRLLVAGAAVLRHGNPRRSGRQAACLLGDRGTVDEAGNLSILGRATPLAKIGGRRVDPLEVERAIKALGNVTDAYVRVAQAAGCDRLFALVETALDQHQLREMLRSALPEWKIPRKIVTAAQLSRDERGKVKRADVDALLGVTVS